MIHVFLKKLYYNVKLFFFLLIYLFITRRYVFKIIPHNCFKITLKHIVKDFSCEELKSANFELLGSFSLLNLFYKGIF